MADYISVEVGGIPVSIDVKRLGKMSVMRAFGRASDESLPEFQRVLASYEWAEKVLGAEQLDNVKRSLDPDEGDPDGTEFVQFAMRCIEAASAERSAEAKN